MDNEVARRNDIAQTYKDNFVDIQKKLTEQGNECKKLIATNLILKDRVVLIEQLLKSKGLDAKSIRMDLSGNGFQIDNEHKVEINNYNRKHEKLSESLGKCAFIQKEFQTKFKIYRSQVVHVRENNIVSMNDKIKEFEVKI